jgi:hypothetical protein
LTIGGNYASTGADPALSLLSGVILPDDARVAVQPGSKGLVQEFLGAGLPVVQILNIEDLSTRYGLPYDPVVLQAIGKARVYHHGLESGLGPWARLGLLALVVMPLAGAILGFAGYRRRIREAGS